MVLVSLYLVVAPACRFDDDDLGDLIFKCEEDEDCPDGQVCDGELCEDEGTGDDAAPSVCEPAKDTELDKALPAQTAWQFRDAVSCLSFEAVFGDSKTAR